MTKATSLALFGFSAVATTALGFGLAGCAANPSPAQAGSQPEGVYYLYDENGDASIPLSISLANTGARTVNVNATDSVAVEPDQAELSLSIEVTEDTAEAAEQGVAQRLASITAGLEGAGIPAESVNASQVRIYAQYDWSESYQKVCGYQAHVEVDVRNLTIDQAGLSVTCAARVDGVSVGGIAYYVSDYEAQYQAALESALVAAQAKAQALADSAGLELGLPVSIKEGYESQAYRNDRETPMQAKSTANFDMAEEEAAAAGEGGGVSLNPGTVTIEATVDVVYELV